MPLETKKSFLCVGGPIGGQRYAAMSGAGFRVPVRPPLARMISLDAEDYQPPVVDVRYRIETIHTSQGSVEIWVPSDQTQLETMLLLLEAYENANRPTERIDREPRDED